MKTKDISFQGNDGYTLRGYYWSPDKGKVKAVVQIVHGMAEQASRYARFAEALCQNGYAAYAYDQRGHGRTAGAPEKTGVLAERDSLNVLVSDAFALTTTIRKEHPGLPVFMFAHSMGSFVAQGFIQQHSQAVDALVLSGSNGKQGPIVHIGKMVAAAEIRKNGREFRSAKLDQLSFGSFNKAFRPNRTAFDWLSRDEAEVDKYVNDPYCGQLFSAGYFYDLVCYLIQVHQAQNLKRVSTKLPVLLIAGEEDPVGNKGKGVRRLYECYRSLGLSDLAIKLYPGARHEVLNETNRDEVTSDVITWLDKHRI